MGIFLQVEDKYALNLKFFDFECCISTNIRHISEGMKRIYNPFVFNKSFSKPHLLLSITGSDEGYSLVTKNAKWTCSKRQVFSVADYMIFDEFDCFERPGYWRLHAAALEKDNRALLLAGVSGSGKTTLALTLVDWGFSYLSDDVALLGKESCMVVPFLNSFHLKDGAWEIFDWLKEYVDQEDFHLNMNDQKNWYLSPQKMKWIKTGQKARVCTIIFPQYDPCALGTSCVSLKAGEVLEKVVHVLNCNRRSKELTSHIFNFLRSTARKNVQYASLKFSDRISAANAIIKFFNGEEEIDEKETLIQI